MEIGKHNSKSLSVTAIFLIITSVIVGVAGCASPTVMTERKVTEKLELTRKVDLGSMRDQATLERIDTGFHYSNPAIGLSFQMPSTWCSVSGRNERWKVAVKKAAEFLNDSFPEFAISENELGKVATEAVYLAVRPVSVNGKNTLFSQFGIWVTPLADIMTYDEVNKSTVEEVFLPDYREIVRSIPGARGEANAIKLHNDPEVFGFSYSLPSPLGTHRHCAHDFLYKYNGLLVQIKISHPDSDNMVANIVRILNTIRISLAGK